MRAPHLLCVTDGPEVYAGLFAAVREAGLRAGWLESSDPPPPPDLAAAAELGVLRAVAVGERSAVIVKPRRGRPVLKDLLREHFRGCALVLVRGSVGGPVEAPSLCRKGEVWSLSFGDGGHRTLSTDGLVAALRRPDPWKS